MTVSWVIDPTVQVAMVGIFTTIVTTAGLVTVAVINNRKERGGSASSAAGHAYGEQLAAKDATIVSKNSIIQLRDEQLADAKEDIEAERTLVRTLELENAKKAARIEELEAQLDLKEQGSK